VVCFCFYNDSELWGGGGGEGMISNFLFHGELLSFCKKKKEGANMNKIFLKI